ncbi:hypothetical protein CCHL11_02313 [Colletotrichum chlorophyti]|uniref:Uncharacterized protein n=1 Tax=Colletotrichum chlorophyti TaxID=708187 RepID=A0A1Q8S639_9PEZI|nr:hypothetical protein CCHL11_02313 [Colletotrichum chlorophyti]
MQLSTIISVTLLALGVQAAYPGKVSGPNGKRICVGGAISCQYEKGRCAEICGDSPALNQGTPLFIDPNCSCPEGQPDNKYTGAACIDVVRALARQGC